MEELFISANDIASFIYNGSIGKSEKMTLLSELWTNYRSCLEKYLRLDEHKFYQCVDDFLTRMNNKCEISCEIQQLKEQGYDIDESDYFVDEGFKDYLGIEQGVCNGKIKLIISFKHKFFGMLIARPAKFRLSEALNLFGWSKRSNVRNKTYFSLTDNMIFTIYQCLAFYHISIQQNGVRDINLFIGKDVSVNEAIELTLL